MCFEIRADSHEVELQGQIAGTLIDIRSAVAPNIEQTIAESFQAAKEAGIDLTSDECYYLFLNGVISGSAHAMQHPDYPELSL